jgi:hypothetical protein
MVVSPLVTLAAPLEVESLMARALNLKREEMPAAENPDSYAAARTTNGLNPMNPPSPTHGVG